MAWWVWTSFCTGKAVGLYWRWHLVCSSVQDLLWGAEQLERARHSWPVPEIYANIATGRLFTLSFSLPLPS